MQNKRWDKPLSELGQFWISPTVDEGGTFLDGRPEPVPEPTTMVLLGSGLVGLIGFRKRLRRN